ncbi:HlyD family secretion protein [Starkeya sp. ORNL1]|uniref:efflux RND transporter periplasmic adaptor subunit n=1 Tax=Starkeya sp. ORNL1 TaxID=2709380 RepID=UPI001462A735|nr:HlyD family secretion protein [Starkeya sp. ORNL1]QJP17928.1 HlyD family secretion protein [Starkeya sp. ORNL1]
MGASARTALRVAVTFIAAAAAFYVGWWLWDYYTLAPWTRDARVQANIVELAPDVSGLVTAINVTDNQLVKKGDVLFVIDPQRFQVALDQARATVEQRQQALKLAQDDARRDAEVYSGDPSAISVATAERSRVSAAEAQAALQQAQAALASAQLDLTRSQVRAPVNGYVTNLTASVGDYARIGKGVLALVDSDSFYVYAYFMETKLPAIRDGDPAEVWLMAGGTQLRGTVQGLSRAIADPDAAGGLLASVNPNFDWIRLAQRIPVRIKLDNLPSGVRLAAGMSATVAVHPASPP